MSALAIGGLAAGVPIALAAGALSFASPCVLPLVPGYLGYVGGMDGGAGRRRMTAGALLFVAGFSAVFLLGTVAFASVGFALVEWRDVLTRVLGVIVIVLGLVFIGGFGPLQRIVKPAWQPRTGLAGAPLLGIAFAIGWSPCVGPMLTVILGLATQSGSATTGLLLAVVYCIGLGLPFVLIALGLGWATRSWTFLKRHVRAINLAGGGMLVLVGILMVSGAWVWLTEEVQLLWGGVVPAI